MLAVNDSGEQALVAVQTKNARHASADERFDALFIGRQGGRIQGIFLPRDASVMRIMPGCSEAGMRGDGVPSLFSTGGTRPPLPPTFLD